MKRAITIFLIGIMMLVMSACGWKPASDEIEMESESVGTTEEQDSSTSDTKTESSEDEIHYADLLPVTTDYLPTIRMENTKNILRRVNQMGLTMLHMRARTTVEKCFMPIAVTENIIYK